MDWIGRLFAVKHDRAGDLDVSGRQAIFATRG